MLDQEQLARLISGNQISADTLLSFLQNSGIMTGDEVRNVNYMKRKDAVLARHNHAITQGTGKDTRWFSRIDDPVTGKGKRIAAPTQEAIIDKLYEHYFAEARRIAYSLKDIYPEWKRYKYETTSRANNIHRIDTDYHKYYENEPLSEDILNRPLSTIKPMDIKLWACSLIKKYDMTKKKFGNVILILRQVYDYMMELDLVKTNPARIIRIDQGLFHREEKASASTQIFYPDELRQILRVAYEHAEETLDESYLAIPIAAYTGLRPAECLGLGFDDFNAADNTLYVHQSLAVLDVMLPDGTWEKRRYTIQEHLKKNAKPRTIQIPDICLRIVEDVRRILSIKEIRREHLFEVKTPNNLEMKLYRICDELGIPRRSPHKLRKTYISTLLNQQFDADFARSQAGHSTLQTTYNSYTYSTTRNNELIDKLNAVIDY